MGSIIRLPLLLVLPLCIVSSIGFAERNGRHPVVHIISGMSRNSEPFSITCKADGTFFAEKTLAAGDDYQWIVEVKDIYHCMSVWGRMFAAWYAYEPARDAGHGTIFSLVNRNGFFLSWNDSTWRKIANWETD